MVGDGEFCEGMIGGDGSYGGFGGWVSYGRGGLE